MHSLKMLAPLLATAILSLGARAQYTYYIDPESVSPATRSSWCVSQQASCPLLCLQLQGDSSTTVAANSCDPATLEWECTCGNGETPDAANYTQTIPYYVCTEYGTQCVAACGGGDSACQSACRADHPCGAQVPPSNDTSTTSSTARPSRTGAPTTSSDPAGVRYTGYGTGAAAAPTSGPGSSGDDEENGSQATLDIARSHGLAIVFSGLFAGFALAL